MGWGKKNKKEEKKKGVGRHDENERWFWRDLVDEILRTLMIVVRQNQLGKSIKISLGGVKIEKENRRGGKR